MYADVLIEIKAKALDRTFTYKVPDNMNIKKGVRALVPFGNRTLEGFVLNVYKCKNLDYEVKEIIKCIDDYPVINDEMLSLGKYISKKTLSPLISAYQTMLPKALKAKHNTQINKKYVTYLKVGKETSLTTPKQKEVYEFIKNQKEALKKDATAISVSAVKTLISKGAIVEIQKEEYRLHHDIKEKKLSHPLTEEQQKVISAVDINTFQPYLLHGVTGSGKTYVYIKLIEEVLAQNKEAILLVPEISLTPQVTKIFKSHFGSIVAILHSALSDGEKYDEWRKIERKEVSIVIGARSAVFAPFNNLGIIIIDEEHSSTYKQENTPRYNTVDVAIKRAKTHNCPLILGSATPSIDSYTRAKAGIYKLLEMKQRVNKNLPTVHLVNMQEEYKKGNRVFSEVLKQKINDRLTKGEQVIVLLNRRGFSTVITCKSCGFTHKCPSCDIPLTYHKNINSMKCHYCNYTVPKLRVCPSCGSKNINALGLGTERLEELIQNEFKSSKVVRMDQDTTRKKSAYEKILTAFGSEKYNILVGTQMIAKGLDFPKVTLVCVINGDASLNIPDYKSAERTYALLSQVAGRAGRSDLKGDVIIQGFNLDHYSIISAKNHDYNNFYKEEIKIRKTLKYPPYYNLCYIKVSGKDYNSLLNEADKIAAYLKNTLPNNIILGPSSASIPKINNVYYMGIIIKFKNTKDVYEPLKFINNKYINNKIDVNIDLNPYKI